MKTQPFPEGATSYTGRCSAPLHDGMRSTQVVKARFGFADTGPTTPEQELCADCLADFSVVQLGLPGGELCPFAIGLDGKWHQVKGTLPL